MDGEESLKRHDGRSWRSIVQHPISMERRDDRHVDTRANIRSKLRKIFNIDFKLKLELSANSTVRTFSKLSSDFDSYKRFNRRFLKLLYIFNLVVCLLLAPCEAAYLNQWAVEVKGGMVEANRVALNHGFVNLGQVGGWDCMRWNLGFIF